MDNKNSNEEQKVSQAIDDIFGADFIEIDVNASEPLEKNTIFTDQDEPLFSGEFEEIDSSKKMDDDLDNKNDKEDEQENISELHNVLLPEGKETKRKENKLDMPQNESSFKDKKYKKEPKNTKLGLWFLIGVVLLFTLLFTIFHFASKREETTNCSYVGEDTGYRITDEYRITHRGKVIKYVEGYYNYYAKTDEFKKQIEFLKTEKIPVIVNSNGMPGFTYLYEIGEDYFSVSSHLDFTLFDFDVIDKNNNEANPISYIKIDSRVSYDSLIKDFKKQGYKCTPSK